MKIVSSTDELDRFYSDVLKSSNYVAIDTEFVRHNTYYAKVCLIQLAFKKGTRKEVILIDPLINDINLTSLEKLLKNKKLTKVIHAGRQDLEIFLNLFDFLPIPLFDTQIAAMVCGKGEQESYENLVNNLLGEQINKTCQFTNWAQRPLSEEQIKYASEDVSYLCDIFEHLKRELNELGRSSWIVEEIEKLTDKSNYDTKKNYCLKKIQSVRGDIRFKKLVAIFLDFRESLAQKLNLPRNHVIKDDSILRLAKSQPKTAAELTNLKIFSSKIKNVSSHNSRILAICDQERISKKKEPVAETKDKLTENEMNTFTLLKVLLKMKSIELGVPPKLIATTKDLEIITQESNPDVPALQGWRKEIFGLDAMKLKHGKIALCISKSGIKAIETIP